MALIHSPKYPEHEDRRTQTVRALRMYLLYRLLLSLALGFAFFTGTGPSLLGHNFPDLFAITISAYLLLIGLSGMLLLQKRISTDRQVQITLLIDIVAITLLMHASGGIRSGLGLLITVSLTIGSLLMRGRLSLLFAALGSLVVLGEQVYAQLVGNFTTTAYTQGGLLGITFFSVALLARILSLKLRETEHLARQRGLDLANMAQLNEYIIHHMNTGVLVVNGANRIMMVNETARQQLRLGHENTGVLLDQVMPSLAAFLQNWQDDPDRSPGDYHPGKDARALIPKPIPLGQDRADGTLIFLEDSARMAEQAQQMKLASLGRFTASIAHEIRNPLGAISHAGQLLAESPQLESADRRLTQIIQSNSQRVNDIIESILKLSRRKAAQTEIIPLNAWLGAFVEDFCQGANARADAIALHPGPDKLQVKADSRQLHQVLWNLCDNAFKYGGGEKAGFRLGLEAGLSPETGIPRLEISDNGPGIAPEHIEQIFEPFFTTGAKGTGLGLYIAKELCETNRIDLEYAPGPDGGSRFRLHFRAWKPSD